ncbi:hypothetical protein YC2023_046719 [Brassica napus]
MEEKWKLSKKETTTSSSSKSKFSRSFSTSASSAKSPLFARSSSTKCSVPLSSSSSSSISRSFSRKERKSSSSPSSSITRKYSSLAKEQKARGVGLVTSTITVSSCEISWFREAKTVKESATEDDEYEPTLLDQGTETWDEESGNTRSGRLEQSLEDEEQV